MSEDEPRSSEMIDGDEADGADRLSMCAQFDMRHKKNRDVVTRFLGVGPAAYAAYSTGRYYRKQLVWAVKRVTMSPGWKTISVHGYLYERPVYRDVQTDYAKWESCLFNGQMFLEKDGARFVVTVLGRDGTVQAEAAGGHDALVKRLVQDIADFLRANNFCRGKKITLGEDISFLDAGCRDWDSVVLDSAVKREIHLNTVGFLRNRALWEKLGIPVKRGIILAGEPGTGKTIVCQALMSDADGITCIATDPYGMLTDGYISGLFSVAQDLSPSIVFIEDIDLIAQERHSSHRGAPPITHTLPV